MIPSTNTMRTLLKSKGFQWISEECEQDYHNAIGANSRKALRALWTDHQEWRENIGDAICLCLEALVETGVSEKEKILKAFWVHKPNAK
jgi:hypothetical protein